MRIIIVGVIDLLVGVSVTQLRVERNKRQEHEKWLAQKLVEERGIKGGMSKGELLPLRSSSPTAR
jgi:hypothetical protein